MRFTWRVDEVETLEPGAVPLAPHIVGELRGANTLGAEIDGASKGVAKRHREIGEGGQEVELVAV